MAMEKFGEIDERVTPDHRNASQVKQAADAPRQQQLEELADSAEQRLAKQASADSRPKQ